MLSSCGFSRAQAIYHAPSIANRLASRQRAGLFGNFGFRRPESDGFGYRFSEIPAPNCIARKLETAMNASCELGAGGAFPFGFEVLGQVVEHVTHPFNIYGGENNCHHPATTHSRTTALLDVAQSCAVFRYLAHHYGLPAANHCLAWCYAGAQGVPGDDAEASRLITLAAAQGQRSAELAVGADDRWWCNSARSRVLMAIALGDPCAAYELAMALLKAVEPDQKVGGVEEVVEEELVKRDMLTDEQKKSIDKIAKDILASVGGRAEDLLSDSERERNVEEQKERQQRAMQEKVSGGLAGADAHVCARMMLHIAVGLGSHDAMYTLGCLLCDDGDHAAGLSLLLKAAGETAGTGAAPGEAIDGVSDNVPLRHQYSAHPRNCDVFSPPTHRHHLALARLAEIYTHGAPGVCRDPRRAERYKALALDHEPERVLHTLVDAYAAACSTTSQDDIHANLRAMERHGARAFALGACHALGHSGRVDATKAMLQMIRGAREGDMEAEYLLGMACATGQGVAQDLSTARQHFDVLLDDEDMREVLIKKYRRVVKDPESVWYFGFANRKQSAERLVHSMVALQGNVGDQAQSLAMAELHDKADAQHDGDAQYLLAVCYEHGLAGRRVDRARALRYYRMAATRGHVNAQVYLGCAYDTASQITHPNSMGGSENEGRYWFELASAQEDVHARYNLAASFDIHRLTKAGARRVARDLEWCAERGHLSAEARLGVLINDVFREPQAAYDRIEHVVGTATNTLRSPPPTSASPPEAATSAPSANSPPLQPSSAAPNMSAAPSSDYTHDSFRRYQPRAWRDLSSAFHLYGQMLCRTGRAFIGGDGAAESAIRANPGLAHSPSELSAMGAAWLEHGEALRNDAFALGNFDAGLLLYWEKHGYDNM